MKSLRLGSIFLSIMISCFSSVAEESAAPVLATGDWEPFTGSSLPGGGLMVEIVEAALKSANQPYKIEFLPWKRGYNYAIEMKVMGAFPWIESEERKKIFNFTDSVHQANERFFVRKDFEKKYNKDEDLEGLVICLPMGWATLPIKRFLDKKLLTLYRPHTDDACFKALNAKRVDIYSVNEITGWEAIKKVGLKTTNFKIIGPIIRENNYFIVISRRHPKGTAFIENFNKGMKLIKESGSYQKIVDKHMKLIQGQ